MLDRDLKGRDGGYIALGIRVGQMLPSFGGKPAGLASRPEENASIEEEPHRLYSSGQSSESRGWDGSSWKTIFPKTGWGSSSLVQGCSLRLSARNEERTMTSAGPGGKSSGRRIST